MGHDQQHAWLWTSDYRAGEEGSVAVHALTALTTATPPALHASPARTHSSQRRHPARLSVSPAAAAQPASESGLSWV